MEIGMEYALTDAGGREVGRVLVVPAPGGPYDRVELWAHDPAFSRGGTYTFKPSARALDGAFEAQRDAYRAEQASKHAGWWWVEAWCTPPKKL
jgi:hypothetical protein